VWRKVAPVPAGLGGGMELGEPPAAMTAIAVQKLARADSVSIGFRPRWRRLPCKSSLARTVFLSASSGAVCRRAGPRVSRYRLGHARCVRRCGRPSALVETRHAARDGHPCHRRTRADACPDGLGARDVRRPYEADFADLASGAFKGRSSATQRAMFNFSGHALADLAVAQVVYETALRKGLGTRLARW